MVSHTALLSFPLCSLLELIVGHAGLSQTELSMYAVPSQLFHQAHKLNKFSSAMIGRMPRSMWMA